MNKARREELLEVIEILDDATERLSEIRDDEQDAYDSLPESFQDSAKGEVMLEAIDMLETIENSIEAIKQEIEEYVKATKVQRTKTR